MTLRQTDNIFDAQASRVETSTTSGVGWRFGLLAFALYLGSAALSLLVSNTVGGVATMWFANAVLIGLIWRNRGRGLLMAMAGSVLASVIIKTAASGSPFVALALSAVNLLEIALALWLIDRVNCGRRGTYAEVPVILLGGIVAPLASALAAAFILHPYPETGISDFWPLWWTWWTGSALGAIIALPIVLTARRCAIRDAFTGRRAIEFALIAPPSLAFAAYLAAENEFPLVMVSVVLLLAATRLNRFATALLSAVCATLVLTIISHDWHIADDVDGIMRHLPVLVPAWIAMAAPYFVALLRDQHRNSQQSLIESERRFRGAMDNAAIGMALVSPEGRPIEVNRALCDMLGYSVDEITRMNFAEFTHPDDLSSDLEQMRRVLDGEIDSYFLEKRFIRKDGTTLWGHLAASATRNAEGRVVQFIAQLENIDKRKRAEDALATSESRWSFALESARHGVWDRDIPAGRTYYSTVWKAMLGYSDREVSDLSSEWARLIHPDDLARADELDRACIDGGCESFECELRMRHKDGHWVWILDRGRVIARDDRGRATRMIGTHVDISARKQAEQDLRDLSSALFEEKERLRITLYSIGDAVICADTDARITFMNPAAEQLTGWRLADADGRPAHEIFRIVDAAGTPLPCAIEACLHDLRSYYLREDTQLVTHDGQRLTVQDSASPIRNADGELLGAVLVFQDMTRSRALQNELAQSALIDPLTGLPNRKALEQRLVEADTAVRLGRRRVSLCFIDLDRFKILNDSMGHAAGDSLLVAVAGALRASTRPEDEIHRLGGDEFAILMSSPLEEAEQVTKTAIRAIAALPFAWEGRSFALTASAGVAEIPVEGIAISELMSRADVACYTAKSTGRNKVSLYRPEESEAGRYHRDIQIASGIRAAIAADRFRIFAQRIECLQAGDCAQEKYFEILLRLEDENGELMYPGAFIPAAERYDLMSDIDRWVISTTLRRYGARLRALGDFAIAINLSANSLNDPALWQFVRQELDASGIEPRRLNFEITETALIDNLEAANDFVAKARATGCGITLDDFGAGLSSFSYLRQFPVDQLKIDGNFVRQIVNSPVDRAIVESINDLGHKFGARTIAEFVEDEATLELLRDLGIDMAQGYCVARPVPIEDILAAAGA